jgi:uncharacterized protein (TIGR02284 family)
MSNDELVDLLNDLLETCYDGLDGFRAAVADVHSNEVIEFCQSRIQRIDEAAADLYTAIRHLGGHPAEHGHQTARVHRGWLRFRVAVATRTDAAILAEIERGEEQAAKHYHAALEKPLPESVHDLIQEQSQGADENLERVRSMRSDG